MAATLELERLSTVFLGDASDLFRTLTTMETRFRQIDRISNNATTSVANSFVRIGGAALTTLAPITAVGTAVGALAVKVAGDLNSMESSFTLLTDNVEGAAKTIEGLRDYSLNSPFDIKDLYTASTQLASFGMEVENIVPTMKELGDVAAGVNKPFNLLAYSMGALHEQGRNLNADVRQLAKQNVPIYLELAKVLQYADKGATRLRKDQMDQIKLLLTEGVITYELVDKAFKNMTGKGADFTGRFHGQAENKANQLPGMLSTLKNQIEFTLADIGNFLTEGLDLKYLIDSIKDAAKQVSYFFKTMDEGTKRTIITVIELTAVFTGLAAILYFGSVAVTALLSPLGLVFIGIIGLVAGVTKLSNEMGGLSVLTQTVSNFGDAVGRAFAEFDGADKIDKVGNFFVGLGNQILDLQVPLQKFVTENEDLVNTLLGLGVVVGTVIAVYKVLAFTTGTVIAVSNALGITWILSKALLVAWTGIVILAKVATWLYSIAVFLLTVDLAALIAMALVNKVTFWLLSAATAVLTLNMTALFTAVISGIVIFGVLAAAVLLLNAAFFALGTGIATTASALWSLASSSGVFAEGAKFISRWGEEFKYVFSILKEDGALAWEIFKLQAEIVLLHIKGLLPSLWEGLKVVFMSLGDLIVELFDTKLAASIKKFELGIHMALLQGTNLGGINDELIKTDRMNLKLVDAKEADMLKGHIEDFNNKAVKAFKKPAFEGDPDRGDVFYRDKQVFSGKEWEAEFALENLKKRTDATLAMRKAFKGMWAAMDKEEAEKALDKFRTGSEDEPIGKGHHSIDFTTIVNSAEAKKHLEEYLNTIPSQEFLDRTRTVKDTTTIMGARPTEQKMIDLLSAIAENTARVADIVPNFQAGVVPFEQARAAEALKQYVDPGAGGFPRAALSTYQMTPNEADAQMTRLLTDIAVNTKRAIDQITDTIPASGFMR